MVMLRSILENRNISCRSHLVYVLLQSTRLSACCTSFSTSNGSSGWRPNIKKQLNLVVLETLVKLMANKAPSMKSSQSFPFLSMPFLRMSSYCFRPESDILSLTLVSLYPDPIGCKIGKKAYGEKENGGRKGSWFHLRPLLFFSRWLTRLAEIWPF